MVNSFATVLLAVSIATALPVQKSAGPNHKLSGSTRRVVAQLAGVEAPAAKSQSAPRSAAQRHSIGAQIAGGIIGGVAGFFAGAYVGGAIENHFSPCRCDDPGLKGAVIGAPIGAVAGAIFGTLLSRD